LDTINKLNSKLKDVEQKHNDLLLKYRTHNPRNKMLENEVEILQSRLETQTLFLDNQNKSLVSSSKQAFDFEQSLKLESRSPCNSEQLNDGLKLELQRSLDQISLKEKSIEQLTSETKRLNGEHSQALSLLQRQLASLQDENSVLVEAQKSAKPQLVEQVSAKDENAEQRKLKEEELRKLREELNQRDSRISILAEEVKKLEASLKEREEEQGRKREPSIDSSLKDDKQSSVGSEVEAKEEVELPFPKEVKKQSNFSNKSLTKIEDPAAAEMIKGYKLEIARLTEFEKESKALKEQVAKLEKKVIRFFDR
jgi:chromosome segregation ATPase